MAGDASWANVSLLLHGEGSNGGTTFGDSSGVTGSPVVGAPGTVTGATTVTSDSKFGASSIKLAASSSNKLVWTGKAALLMTGDFTLEGFVKIASRASLTFFTLLETEAAGRATFYTDASGVLTYNRFGQTAPTFSASTTAFPLNTWFHLAYARSGSTIRCFVDGALIGSATDSATLGNGTGGLTLSSAAATDLLWDDVRISKGLARYTAAFTAPAATFPDGMGSISGVVTDSAGANAARTVRAYRRDTGAFAGSATSDGTTGAYSIWTPTLDEVTVVALDSATSGTYYDDVCARVIPA